MITIDSASDGRTADNPVRQEHCGFSDAEELQLQKIKDLGAAFIAQLHEIGGTDGTGRQASDDLALAQLYAEDAVVRVARHITASRAFLREGKSS